MSTPKTTPKKAPRAEDAEDVQVLDAANNPVVSVEDDERADAGEDEDRLENPDYKAWKKNAPFLYDLLISEVLEHPSLTVSFLPGRTIHDDRHTQRLVLGTHTFGSEQDMLLVAQLTLPLEETEIEAQPRHFDADRMEVGGYGLASHKNVGTLAVDIKIPHKLGEVHRARCNPLRPTLIATKGNASDVCVYDYSNYSSVHLLQKQMYDMKNYEPTYRLSGHKAEGYGLNWSPHNASLLLSGSYDNTVLLFDLEGATGKPAKGGPLHAFLEHTGFVEDVAWHAISPHLFGSCGDDQHVRFWDLRTQAAACASHLHTDHVNSLCFDPHSDFFLASASSDGTVLICDMRRMDAALFTLRAHEGDVLQVAWCPSEPTIVASAGGADHKVMLWDLSRIDPEPAAVPEEAGAAPPELVFIHGGHATPVVDLSWSTELAGVLATVEEAGVVQVWQPAAEYVVGGAYGAGEA